MITEHLKNPPIPTLVADTEPWALIEDPIWVFDLDHYRVVWANEPALELWKSEALEELQSRDMSDLSDFAKALLGEYADGFAQDKRYEATWTLRPRDTEVNVRYRCRGVAATDGRILMLVHCIGIEGRDSQMVARADQSDELIALREQLAHAEARYRAFAEAGSDWLWETDENHRFVYYSPRVVKHFGYPLDGVLGLTRSELAKQIGADPDTEETRAKWAAHEADQKAQRPFRDFEYAFRKGTGQIGYAAISGDPVFSPDGEFKGYRGVGRDVTRRVEAERYAREMERERDVAVTANSVTNQFLATMSHELRTPLNAIVGFSEVMMDELFGEMGNEKYREYVADILSSSRHLLSIVEDLLNVSRLDIADENLNLEWMSAGEFIEEMVRMTRSLTSGRKLQVLTDLPERRYEFHADRRALRQVLFNLISNAVKFTPAGGEVSVRCAPSAFGGTEIIVRDTGCGIDHASLKHIFEPFRSNNAMIANRHGGAGLGLWISRRIVDAHGGEIDVDSEPEQGTSVRVWLPDMTKPSESSLEREAS